MAQPQPHKTSVLLTSESYLMLQAMVAQRQDLTQADVMNISIKFLYDHIDDPEFDLLTTKLDTIAKRLDDLLARAPAPLDTDALVQSIVAHLTPPTPPPAPPPAPAPQVIPQTRGWFKKRPQEHW